MAILWILKSMFKHFPIWTVSCLLFFLSNIHHNNVLSQDLARDTLHVSFPIFDSQRASEGIVDSVLDERDGDPTIIGVYEVNKYLFIPVDLFICTPKTLAEEIAGMFSPDKDEKDALRFNLVIRDFQLTRRTQSWIYPHYRLNASIGLYEKGSEGDPKYLGELLYESSSRTRLFGDKLEKGFSKVLGKFRKTFIQDLSHVSERRHSLQSIALEHFRKSQYTGKRSHLFGGVDAIVTSQGFITDIEVFFSHREARRRFFRSGGQHLRYRNMKDYESIEFGLSIDYLYHRINPRMVFRGKSQIMLGVNRWKDIETRAHKLYDIFILDYALSQSLIVNPLDRGGILFGIGFQQSIAYIYSKNIQVQLGVVIHVGLKL